MRYLAISITSLVVLGASALAGGKRAAEIPAECRTWADDAARARTEPLKLGAELSLASCELEARVPALDLTGDDASIKALADAAAPTLAILDGILQGDDPAYQILAAQAKGDLYDAMVVRMRNTERSDLEPRLEPWSQAAAVAYAEALRIAKLHPELAGANPVVASAVRSSASRLQARTPPTRR